jgi:hypothetical protein
MHNSVEEWGMSYFAHSYKEAKRMFWKAWHSELEDYINVRGHQIKEVKPIPKILQKKGEVPLLLGYLIGAYSYYSNHVQCPLCHMNSIDIDESDERLVCESCLREITIEDLVRIEEAKAKKVIL